MQQPNNISPCYCNTLRRATRAVTGLYDRKLEPAGLTLPQLSLLRQLKKAGPLSITRLAEVVGLERTTLGRNMRPLEQAGLVESVASEVDARERVVKVSRSGDQVMERAAPLWRKAQQAIEHRLGKDRVLLLREILVELETLRT